MAALLPSMTVPKNAACPVTGSKYRRCTSPNAVTLFQTPFGGRVLIAFSVCRKPTTNGAAVGSCLMTAFRY
jgi:hypothetical protein